MNSFTITLFLLALPTQQTFSIFGRRTRTRNRLNGGIDGFVNLGGATGGSSLNSASLGSLTGGLGLDGLNSGLGGGLNGGLDLNGGSLLNGGLNGGLNGKGLMSGINFGLNGANGGLNGGNGGGLGLNLGLGGLNGAGGIGTGVNLGLNGGLNGGNGSGLGLNLGANGVKGGLYGNLINLGLNGGTNSGLGLGSNGGQNGAGLITTTLTSTKNYQIGGQQKIPQGQLNINLKIPNDYEGTGISRKSLASSSTASTIDLSGTEGLDVIPKPVKGSTGGSSFNGGATIKRDTDTNLSLSDPSSISDDNISLNINTGGKGGSKGGSASGGTTTLNINDGGDGSGYSGKYTGGGANNINLNLGGGGGNAGVINGGGIEGGGMSGSYTSKASLISTIKEVLTKNPTLVSGVGGESGQVGGTIRVIHEWKDGMGPGPMYAGGTGFTKGDATQTVSTQTVTSQPVQKNDIVIEEVEPSLNVVRVPKKSKPNNLILQVEEPEGMQAEVIKVGATRSLKKKKKKN